MQASPGPLPADWIPLARVLDANANRAEEGLRVLEEYARFALEDAQLTADYKQVRHDLAAAVAAIPDRDRLLARDTPGDVGTHIDVEDEYHRSGLQQIVLANQKRVEQALRCLEEYAKPRGPAAAQRFETLRYRVYTLARQLHILQHSRTVLDQRRLYVLVEGQASSDTLAALARTLLAAGADILQLRDKTLGDRELLARARVLRELTQAAGKLLIINDRPDLARLAGADGVHLGQDDLPVRDARAILGPDGLIGVSTHSLAQARQAVADGANYLGCGPTFPSLTKQFETFPGVEFLKQVADEIALPAFAIGGVTLDNLEEVIAAGFSRVAVGAAATKAADPGAVIQRFRQRLAQVGTTNVATLSL